MRVNVPVPIARELVLVAMMRPEPAPCRMIPFPEIVTPDVQVHVPAGIRTVSPSAAELMALCTSEVLQDAALRVFARAAAPKTAPKERN